jgi:hypothetical protein
LEQGPHGIGIHFAFSASPLNMSRWQLMRLKDRPDHARDGKAATLSIGSACLKIAIAFESAIEILLPPKALAVPR